MRFDGKAVFGFLASLAAVFGLLILPAGAAERTLIDRPDEVRGYQVKVLYVLPADGRDRRLDLNGAIELSVASAQRWLKRRTKGPAFRLDTYKGKLDILFVRLRKTDAQIAKRGAYVRDAIESELKARNFNHPKKLYAVYYDGSSAYACGGGAWPPKLKGNVMALYLRGKTKTTDCSINRLAPTIDATAYWEKSFIHEILHTLGFAASCAKNHTRAGHVSDHHEDLMYAGDKNWRPYFLDLNNNDYFNHGRIGCLDFARSAFLEPLPANPQLPPGWSESR